MYRSDSTLDTVDLPVYCTVSTLYLGTLSHLDTTEHGRDDGTMYRERGRGDGRGGTRRAHLPGGSYMAPGGSYMASRRSSRVIYGLQEVK